MTVDLSTGLAVGAASALFATDAILFSVSADGSVFLPQVPNHRRDYPPLVVRTNYFDEIRAKMKSRRRLPEFRH